MADITVSADIHSFLQAASDAAARTALCVDAAGTDNSTAVTLAGTGTYISIAGQVITVDGITESDITDLGTYLTDLTGDALSTVQDVTITSMVSGEILAWNGSAWINQTLAEAGISATGHTHTASDITDFDTEVGNNTAVAANTAKTGITAQQASDITANNAKVTYDAAAAVALNTAKVTNATHTGDVTGATVLTIAAGAVDLAMLSATGTASGTTFLRGDNTWATPAAGDDATSIQGTDVDGSVGSPSDGDILVYRSAGSDFVLESKPAAGSNPAASDITDATADGIALITSSDANPFTDADESKLDGIESSATADQTGAEIKTAYEAESDTNAFTDAEKTKLSGIETGATADQDLSSYQLQPSEGAFANGDKTKLDGIESSANVTDTANVTSAGALMDSEVTNLAQVKAFDSSDYATAAQGTKADSAQQPPSEGAFANGDKTKLDGIEASADVTDATNVTAAGALMDSEVDADIKTLSLPASTTISTFGASLVDDADAAAGRTTLGVDAAGTDNSTNVTLTGSATYLSLAGQAITVDPITESDISDLGTYLTAESDTLDTVTGRGATTTNGVTVGSIDINGEIIEKAVNTTGVTGSTALDPANGTIQRLTFSGDVTFTDSLADGESITLSIDDGSGSTATWPTMEWVGGSAPTLDTTNEHIIVVWKVNSTLYGMASGVAS